jgi:hypothetical protein
VIHIAGSQWLVKTFSIKQCACLREREREIEIDRDRERDREREKEKKQGERRHVRHYK